MPLTYAWRAPEELGADEWPDIYRTLATPLFMATVLNETLPPFVARLERHLKGEDPFAFASDEAERAVEMVRTLASFQDFTWKAVRMVVLFNEGMTRRAELEAKVHKACAALLKRHGAPTSSLKPIRHRPHAVLRRTRAILEDRAQAALEPIARDVAEHREVHIETARILRKRREREAPLQHLRDAADRHELELVLIGGMRPLAVPRAAPGEPDRGSITVPVWMQSSVAYPLHLLGRADRALARDDPEEADALRAMRPLRARVIRMLDETIQQLAPMTSEGPRLLAQVAFRSLVVRIEEHLPEAYAGFEASDDCAADAAALWERVTALDTPLAREAAAHLVSAMALLGSLSPPTGERDATPLERDEEGLAAIDALHELMFDTAP